MQYTFSHCVACDPVLDHAMREVDAKAFMCGSLPEYKILRVIPTQCVPRNRIQNFAVGNNGWAYGEADALREFGNENTTPKFGVHTERFKARPNGPPGYCAVRACC